MWRYMRGVVRCSTTVLLQIFWRIFHWKNFENRLRFDWIMAMSLVCSFWPTLYFWTSLCGSMLLHFTEATSKLSVTVKVCSHFTTHKPNWTELQFWTLHSGSSEQGEQSLRLLPQHLGRGAVPSRKFVDVTDRRWWLLTGGSHQHSFVYVLYQICKTCRLLRRHWCCASFIIA